MEKSQIWLIVGAIVVVSALILRIGSPTNRWVCEYGVWVAQGNPHSAQPTSACADDLSIDDELQALADILNDQKLVPTEVEKDKLSISASSSAGLLPVYSESPKQVVISDDIVVVETNGGDDIKEEAEVILISPQANEVVRNQDVITGQARGNWFFEATFPLLIKDASGEVLATGFVETQDDWMTSEWVAFQGTLNFNVATSTFGELVFKKNNPSALPEYEAQTSYPVRLEP
jgi:hypothetical protein